MSFLPPASASMSSPSSTRPLAEPQQKENFPAGDDAENLRAFHDTGNEAAFTALVRRHLPLVFHAALRRVRSPALAEEAAQNTFALLARKVASVSRHPERLRAWLHRTAFLEACALARKEARLSRLPAGGEPPVFSPMTDRPDLYDELDKALSALPELDRELLLRRYCENDDFRRIAAAVGKSESACQKRVERALARLNASLHAWRQRKLRVRDGRRLPGDARLYAAQQADATGTAVAGMIPAEAGISSVLLPSAGAVVAGALRKQSELAGASGWWTGLNSSQAGVAGIMTASLLAAFAGAWAGRGPGSAPQNSGTSASSEVPAWKPWRTGPPGADSSDGAAPPPERRVRPLAEVLESIQAGRLQPLLDFLPSATPADLKAVLAEDNRVYLSEGSPPPGEARKIALRHWTAIDPQGAFAWARERDTLTSGLILPDSAAVLSGWLKDDAEAALAAFATVPVPDRRAMAEGLVLEDDTMAEQLMARHPEIVATVHKARAWGYDRKKPLNPEPTAEQVRLAAAVSAGTADPTASEEEILTAFRATAFQDADLKLDGIRRIPDPELRTRILSDAGDHFASRLPAPRLAELREALPPGMTRARLTAWLGEKLASQKPDAAFEWLENAEPGLEREVFFRQAAEPLSLADPWRLVEFVAGHYGSFTSTRDVLTGITGNPLGLPVSAGLPGLLNEDAAERLMRFAGEDDPIRALKLLAPLEENELTDPSPGSGRALRKQVLKGWLATDSETARRWVEGQGSARLRAILEEIPPGPSIPVRTQN